MNTIPQNILPKTAGIYCIRNLLNNHFYIGSSVNIHHRWAVHLSHLRKGTHHSQYLQYAWNKYGEETFSVSVIELVNDKNQLTEREQFYIDTLCPEYNVCPNAESPIGRILPLETKAKISKTLNGHPVSSETRDKLSQQKKGVLPTQLAPFSQKGMQGKPHAPQTKEKIRKTLKGHSVSSETREKIRATKTGRKYGPYRPRKNKI